MANESQMTPELNTGNEPTSQDQPTQHPELRHEPGELAPWWSSPFPNAELSEEARNALKTLCDIVGNKDVAARRWEVEQSWEARLFDRGYQYLLPRKGGGWILPPFATNYGSGTSRSNGARFYGYETNVYTTYNEIVTAALTRDIPGVRFQPANPECDGDITAADAATSYARIFSRNNNLLELQHQIAYYLRNDGRCVLVTNHVVDAQRFGREDMDERPEEVPETQSYETRAVAYLVRHGETELNRNGQTRGRSEAP